MITIQITADIPADHRVVLELPPEVPTGRAELLVRVTPELSDDRPPRRSLADWAEANSEHWGDQLRSDNVENFTGRRF